ncbi:hypothetical protein K3495_g4303 [Podosphaera aphanis]|nr:hypothetical protein K3495_g4303 [Podosphaera aphanis]
MLSKRVQDLEIKLESAQDRATTLIEQNLKLTEKNEVLPREGGGYIKNMSRSTSDPDKFDASEKDVVKRQEQYKTWRTKIILNFAEDWRYIGDERTKNFNILRCSGGDVYALNQEILDEVSHNPKNPEKWSIKSSDELFERMNRQFETLDLSQDAAIKFDNLQQGNRFFQNFLETFVALAAKCRKTEEQKVDALKEKVSSDKVAAIKTLAQPPPRDNFDAWADQCQIFYNNQQEFNHNHNQNQKTKKLLTFQAPCPAHKRYSVSRFSNQRVNNSMSNYSLYLSMKRGFTSVQVASTYNTSDAAPPGSQYYNKNMTCNTSCNMKHEQGLPS